MSSTTVAMMFDCFRRFAESANGVVLSEPNVDSFGSTAVRVANQQAQLKLVWSGQDEQLSLHITHGPSGVAQSVGWLELDSALCPEGRIATESDEAPSFSESIAYGFELLFPGSAERGA
jgi:hypothetical protein